MKSAKPNAAQIAAAIREEEAKKRAILLKIDKDGNPLPSLKERLRGAGA